MADPHGEFVTERTRRWFAEERPGFITAQVAVIRAENEAAGNASEDSFDDDIECLADEAYGFAVRELAPDLSTGIAAEFVRDCLSEVDWPELAKSWLETTEAGNG